MLPPPHYPIRHAGRCWFKVGNTKRLDRLYLPLKAAAQLCPAPTEAQVLYLVDAQGLIYKVKFCRYSARTGSKLTSGWSDFAGVNQVDQRKRWGEGRGGGGGRGGGVPGASVTV